MKDLTKLAAELAARLAEDGGPDSDLRDDLLAFIERNGGPVCGGCGESGPDVIEPLSGDGFCPPCADEQHEMDADWFGVKGGASLRVVGRMEAI